MMLLGILLLLAVCYLAARRRARVFNARDRSGDYRTSQQRLAKW